MRLYINIKQAGSRKPLIAKQEIQLEAVPETLRELIAAIVTMNVKSFNNKIEQKNIVAYLTAEKIDDKAAAGKVSFGEIHNDKKASLSQALEAAILAYEDGIYRVFINEQEADCLDGPMNIKEEDVLTFVRLTMLSGRMW